MMTSMTFLKVFLWATAAALTLFAVAGLFMLGTPTDRCLPTETWEQCQSGWLAAGITVEVVLFGLAAALVTIYYLMKRKGYFVPQGR